MSCCAHEEPKNNCPICLKHFPDRASLEAHQYLKDHVIFRIPEGWRKLYEYHLEKMNVAHLSLARLRGECSSEDVGMQEALVHASENPSGKNLVDVQARSGDHKDAVDGVHQHG